jgi:putative acetyltransferase
LKVHVRQERQGDEGAIRDVTKAAFEPVAHSSQTEAAIIEALRLAGVLTVSLVAVVDGEIVGHAAFSPVTINGADCGWHGLGPVSVRPDRQNAGIGATLIQEGLRRLEGMGAQGCVVLGEPRYYRRFGFRQDPNLRFAGAPAEYFMALRMGGPAFAGSVNYHRAFEAA